MYLIAALISKSNSLVDYNSILCELPLMIENRSNSNSSSMISTDLTFTDNDLS